MKIIKSLNEWQDIRKKIDKHLSLGFTPTMGNLHRGHASLLNRARAENEISICSIYVNQTQFNNEQDYLHYPKTLDQDLNLLDTDGVDYCLLPEAQAIYPDHYQYRIEEIEQTTRLEGIKRPGHFTGVLTVVMKLLNLVKAQRAYFGEKDYQQFSLIQGMIKAFFMDTDLVLCPTIRETSGLAYSSRNNRLSPEQRKDADRFATIFLNGSSTQDIKTQLQEAGIEVDYIEEQGQRRFAAVQIGPVRLIDNYDLAQPPSSEAQPS